MASPKSRRPGLIAAIAYVECTIFIVPVLILIATSFTATKYITFPPNGFSLQWYTSALTNSRLTDGLIVSIKVAVVASLVAVGLGVIGGIALTKTRGAVTRISTGLFLGPLAIPAIVIAIGMMLFLGSLGLLRSMTGMVLAHAVITIPYAIRLVGAAMGRDLPALEQAAAVLGANPWQVFWRITIPSLKSGIVASILFAFLISFNNITLALFIAGVRTETLPLVMFNATQDTLTPELTAMATILIVMTIGVLLFLEKKFGVYSALEQRYGA